ncbi:hypothetical protein HYU18_01740 [Candidatus Woesearchaeota archaeon]|nr:hypothetical protein [Candidatus Woesearchaeota archaeon]
MREYSEVVASAAIGQQAGGTIISEAPVGILPNSPEKRFKIGGITATIWKGLSIKGETYYNVQVGKNYKAKDGTWKTTHSLKETDIHKAMVLLQKSYEYVLVQQHNAVLN